MVRFESLKLLICQGEQATSIASRVIFMVGFIFSLVSWSMTEEQIIAALSLPENSTGNIADAIEEATGARCWRSADMKPNFDSRVVATVCDKHRLLSWRGSLYRRHHRWVRLGDGLCSRVKKYSPIAGAKNGVSYF